MGDLGDDLGDALDAFFLPEAFLPEVAFLPEAAFLPAVFFGLLTS